MIKTILYKFDKSDYLLLFELYLYIKICKVFWKLKLIIINLFVKEAY